MNIVVCVKQIMDPEIPMAKFRIDSEARQVIPPEGLPLVISPFDAQAVEAAVRLKEKRGGKITAISLGSRDAADVVRHALSMGVDEGIVLSDDSFVGSDSFATAYILTRAIQKIDAFDLILCGRQAADWDTGMVGSLIAEGLNLPLVTLARNIESSDDNTLKVERVILDGYQVFEVPMPAVVTVSNEIGQPRLPSGWGIIRAARKEIPVWTNQDINAEPSLIGAGAARAKLIRLFIPERQRKCQIVSGESVAEAATNLVAKLRETGMI